MSRYGEILEGFTQERARILNVLDQEENRHIIMRLLGALAFYTHCPQYGYIQNALGREFTDIDFASYGRYFKDILQLLDDLGYEEDKMVTRLFGDRRLLFHDARNGRHIDIFFDQLDFSHRIPLTGRLEADKPTLPLAELLLEKMQIHEINEKDLIDSIMLFREHPLGLGDDEVVNVDVICSLVGKDWGLWRTVSGNLDLLSDRLGSYEQLKDDDRAIVRDRIHALSARIENTPKTAAWKLRASIGERVKWYRDVEELMHR
jgi:hypothetical protein